MLVVSRKRGESIVIGNQVITVTVVDIRGDKVRLGLEADPAIKILRGELGPWQPSTGSGQGESEAGGQESEDQHNQRQAG